MSIIDNKYEVYVVGCDSTDFINKNHIYNTLSENNFNMTTIISDADFILLLPEYKNTLDSVIVMQYSDMEAIEVAESLEDLLRFRDEYESRGI